MQELNGYPIGTAVVITWRPRDCYRAKWGVVYTVESEPFVWREGERIFGLVMDGYPEQEGITCQCIDPPREGIGGRGCYPVAWLRPLSDPDSITEPTEQEIEA